MKKDIFGDVHPHPTECFTVKSELEMDLAPVIAMNFIFLRFEQGGPDPLNLPLVMPASIAPIRATNKVRN